MAKARSRHSDDQPMFDGFDAAPAAAPRPGPSKGEASQTAGRASAEPEKFSADRASQKPARRKAPRSMDETDPPPSNVRERQHTAVGLANDSLPAVLRHMIAPPVDEPVPDLKDQLVVAIDAHSLIYQVFYALPPMTSGGGLPVSAVYGFVGDMLEMISRKRPDYLVAAFDKSEITFRNELYPDYKANRESMPDELRQQIPLIRQAVDAMGIAILEKAGFEADDVLATVAARVEAAGGRCLVVTSDKDCRQLISESTTLYNIRKDQEMDAAELQQVWGIRPDQVIDYQAMVGDPVDNVPGIPLIGPKIAQQLLSTYDTLDGVLNNIDSISGKKRKQNLTDNRQKVFLSRQLVALRRDVEVPIPWSRARADHADLDRADALMEEFGFRRLRSRLKEVFGAVEGEAAAEPTETSAWSADYREITTEPQLAELVDQLADQTVLAVDTETTSTHARGSDLVGISIAWQSGQAAYIPLRAPEGQTVLTLHTVLNSLRPILESEAIAKVGHNLKFDVVVLRSAGIRLAGIKVDTMVADYLLDPGARNHTLDDMARRRLQHATTSIKKLIGTGKKQITMDQVPLSEVVPYACEDVDVPIRLVNSFQEELVDAELSELFQDVEMPLIQVLAEMEFNGIRVDARTLAGMSSRFDEEISDLKAQIFAAAGRSFNLDSPKQLSEVLFDELGLPVIKKTKTGRSTDADVLSQLAVDHPVAANVLQYRQATKLKNTYIDALPQLICEKTGRVHTSFRQDVAATGRLSSSEPNLQNIPIRTPQGKAIRGAFTAGQDDWLLLGADYSQIELRVLAHASGDEALMRAYREDADIHTRVAAEVEGIPEDQVTSDQRRIAKTINFGIVYGQSPFGLARTLGISKEAAREYIELYFNRYAGVEAFMMDTLARCRRDGYVGTMLGRRRRVQGVRDLAKLPESKRRSLTEAERIAINTPIQGSAADLIKLAMLRVHQQLSQSDLQAKLLLQIHDELLLETPAEEADGLAELVRTSMTEVMTLKVPLKVDVAVGPTWADC